MTLIVTELCIGVADQVLANTIDVSVTTGSSISWKIVSTPEPIPCPGDFPLQGEEVHALPTFDYRWRRRLPWNFWELRAFCCTGLGPRLLLGLLLGGVAFGRILSGGGGS